MGGTVDIIRALQREPAREFTTTALVSTLYPAELKVIREHLTFGTLERKRKAQYLKSALHRKALHHIGRLVRAGILTVTRFDAHGEKVYAVTPSVRSVRTTSSIEAIEPRVLATAPIAEELVAKRAFIYGHEGVLTRYNALYVDASKLEGFGHTLRATELAIRLTDDVVAIGGLHTHQRSVRDPEALHELISALTVLTLDEGRRCSLLVETRGEDPLPLIRTLAVLAPRRVLATLIVDGKSLAQSTTHEALAILRERLEKVTVHYAPNYTEPLFAGKAGTYGFLPEQFARHNERESAVTVVTAASACIDLERLGTLPPHTVRETILRIATGLFSVAAQQRLVGTGAGILQTLSPDPASIVGDATIMLRVWNYDWEGSATTITSVLPLVEEQNRLHAHTYRACGIAIHPRIQLSSAFPKFNPDLTTRSYRKWSVASSTDLASASFTNYRNVRLAMNRAFGGIDRLRIFRSGTPSGSEIASELNVLGANGFTLITYDFKPFSGTRRLTEFFSGGNQ
jgi:hypothetical protein